MKHVCHAAWAARGVTPRKQPGRPSSLQTSPSDPRPLCARMRLTSRGVFQQLPMPPSTPQASSGRPSRLWNKSVRPWRDAQFVAWRIATAPAPAYKCGEAPP